MSKRNSSEPAARAAPRSEADADAPSLPTGRPSRRPPPEWAERPVDAAVETAPEPHRARATTPAGDDDADDGGRQPAHGRCHRSAIRNGQRAGPARRDDGDYNLEAFVSAETTLGRPSRRAAGAGGRRSRPPHDRPVPHRYGRRGRLSDRRPGRGRREARRAASPRSKRCWRILQASIRPASAPAISPNASRIQLRERDRFDPGDAGAGRASRSAGQARPRRAAQGSAASTTKISPT